MTEDRESGIGNRDSLNGWTIAKYVLAVAGLALVVTGDRVNMRWLGLVGIGLIAVAFLLRFKHRVPRHRA
jgi:hydrogenase/urease accessory protein HupE